MSREPVVGGDNGGWGSILNDYLLQTLGTDGKLNTTNQSSFTAIGGQSNVQSLGFVPVASGGTQQAGFHIRMDGIATGGSNIYRLAEVIEVQTGGGTGANGLECLNLTVQQNAADDVAFLSGIELAFNNKKRNDPLNPVDQNHYGMTIDAYGGFSIGPAALAIRTAGGAGSNWQRGVWIPLNSIASGGFAFDYAGNGNGAVQITANGLLQFTGAANMGVQFANGAVIQDNGLNQLDLKGATSGIRFLNAAGTVANLTMSNTGTLTLSQYGSGGGQVSVGAADSGGAGFKVLRVPN